MRKKLVDASYLEGCFPASTPPPFEVAPGVRCVPVGALAANRERPEGYVIIGAGKTALDAVHGSSIAACRRATSDGSSRARGGSESRVRARG